MEIEQLAWEAVILITGENFGRYFSMLQYLRLL